eukprot:TRINITY_DN99715_c0_g1_i1.p1 TRINITY_DN99715_c0_g1~~TRINITY_DN99715_c0_g1_i1.p1  ORF type:complete len:470 (-),score=67.80 TRINITY_DN99715_c0_g1_i1:107-1516(-)
MYPASESSTSLPKGAVSNANLRRVPSLLRRFEDTPDVNKLVFVMVGLPARGKSFISMRLARFLRWTGTETRVFNAGNKRRDTETGVQAAGYFDPNNPSAKARREEIAIQVLQELTTWLNSRSDGFAVFDATNTTKERRIKVLKVLRRHRGVGVVFVESICDDPDVLEANILGKLSKSPDYASVPSDEARKDLLKRVEHYAQIYETLDDNELSGADVGDLSYIKLLNLSSHVVAHNIWGRCSMTVLPFLMALHIGNRPVWFVRLPHAEITPAAWRKSGKPWPPPEEIQFSEQPLSASGEAFVEALAKFIELAELGSLAVFTSTHRRGLQLAERLGGGRVRAALCPQDRGSCDGLRLEELRAAAPKVCEDPLLRRFPGGENLTDVMQRLVPVLIEIEQEMRPVLVAASLSTLQVLYCHYAGLSVAAAMTVPLPMHCLLETRPSGGNFVERRMTLFELQAVSAQSSSWDHAD